MSEFPDVKNYRWWLNPVSCTRMATTGVKGFQGLSWNPTVLPVGIESLHVARLLTAIIYFCFLGLFPVTVRV